MFSCSVSRNGTWSLRRWLSLTFTLSINCNEGEAREETSNKNKMSGESPCGIALPVILSLLSKLEAFCFFSLKPDTHIPLQLNVDVNNRSHSCLKGAKWFSTASPPATRWIARNMMFTSTSRKRRLNFIITSSTTKEGNAIQCTGHVTQKKVKCVLGSCEDTDAYWSALSVATTPVKSINLYLCNMGVRRIFNYSLSRTCAEQQQVEQKSNRSPRYGTGVHFIQQFTKEKSVIIQIPILME